MRMERISFAAAAMAVLLAVLVSFSAVMCLNDAFALEADPLPLLGVCAGCALLAVLSCLPKRSWPIGLLAAVVLLAVLIWKKAPFLESLQALVYSVTADYALAFDSMRIVGDMAGDPSISLMVVAAPLAWITAWVVAREGSALLVILVVLPVLVAVLIVVDLAPVLWLILLTGGLLILVVSQSVRERSRTEGGMLAWWLVLPTIILLCAMTVLWPPADYVRADWSQTLQKLTRPGQQEEVQLPSWRDTISAPRVQWSRTLKTVDLKQIGPKRLTGRSMLQYRADVPISYLRGVSLAVYENSVWKALPTETYETYELSENPQLNSAVMVSALDVETRSREPLLYTTYYLADVPEHGAPVDDAYFANTDRQTAYQIIFEASLQYPLGTAQAADRLATEVYTQVPEELRETLTEILAENGLLGGSAEEIIRYVKGCGVYDLNTPGIPAGEDFVLYFLQESRRGYCVHFASAAVMLLRSAGIPARYVTGYSVSGEAGQWTSVTEDDAHAWVEYYTDEIGWRPLDPTPADENENPPEVVLPEQNTTTEVTDPDPDEKPQEPAPETEQDPSVPTAAPKTKMRLHGLLLLLSAALLLCCLRRWMVLQHRRRRCAKGHPNRRALAYWNWLVQLSKVDGLPPEEELLCLAEKARFSQHSLEEAELGLLRQAVDGRIRDLKKIALLKRLWYRYGLILF